MSKNRIEVSRSAILHNYDLLKEKSGLEIIPVIKSDGYGHGVGLVASVLSERKPPYVAVNDVREVKEVHKLVPDQHVLILGAIEAEELNDLNCDKVAVYVHDKKYINDLNNLEKRISVHLDIDTGMHRYGIDVSDLDEYLDLIESCDQIVLDGVSSHLADGDNHEFSFSKQQGKVFDGAVERVLDRGFTPKHIHLANAPGFSKTHSEYATAFRPGIAIFGINPLTTDDPNYSVMDGLQPAMRLMSTVTKVRDLKPGDTISYGRTFTAEKEMEIAIIPIGYYEGLPRSLSNQGALKYDDIFLPVVGRVCMNHTMLDISARDVKVGDEIIVFSNDKHDSNSIEQLSKDYYFFSYGLLTKLNSYVSRVVVD